MLDLDPFFTNVDMQIDFQEVRLITCTTIWIMPAFTIDVEFCAVWQRAERHTKPLLDIPLPSVCRMTAYSIVSPRSEYAGLGRIVLRHVSSRNDQRPLRTEPGS